MRRKTALLSLVALSLLAYADTLFKDDFRGKLGPGWSWVREDPDAWRITDNGLEIRVQPGNLWGGSNNARNVLTRTIPVVEQGAVTLTVTVENKPTSQYEQTNLVWYYDDSNMVKIGLEMVDGQLSLVMGREEDDKTRTLALIPVTETTLQLRLAVREREITGTYRANDTGKWREAGVCELPGNGEAKASLQAYQGPEDAEHWARFTKFSIDSD